MSDVWKIRTLERLVDESKRQEERETTEKRNWWAGYRYGVLAALQVVSGEESENVLQQNGRQG